MKKTSIILFVLFFGLVVKGFSQTTTSKDFFAGKWEITFIGTPGGDNKSTANLVRKDGKLTGELVDATGSGKPNIPITGIEESADKIEIAFSAQGYDVTVTLNKVDDDNLKGTMLGMFDAKAIRIKEK